MKKLGKLFMFSFLAVFTLACKDDENPVTTPVTKGEETLTGSITANRTLNANTIYTLNNFVYVEDGITLTIEPGTIIKGGPKASKGALIVRRGGKIMAEGTKEKPIVFTSSQPKGSRAPGDWGGLLFPEKLLLTKLVKDQLKVGQLRLMVVP